MHFHKPGAAFFSCLFFFVCAGIVYGQFTARIPAIKLHAGINDAQLGVVLLSYGIGSIFGFLGVPFLLKKISSRFTLWSSALVLMAALTAISLAPNHMLLCVIAVVFGLATAFFDVCMNTQAMLLELASHKSRMATMHACYSIGGFLGSLLGSAFAFANASPFLNFLVLSLVLVPMIIVSRRHLLNDVVSAPQKREKIKIPFFIIFCGLMALGAFIAEGSAAEWGGLLLLDVKGADAGVAALCFGAFSAPMALARLTEDALREKLGDFALLFGGSLLAFCGFGLVLLSSWPWICLLGYAILGLGLSPIMPIAISRAGTHGSLPPSIASAIVSLLGYGGLLVVPPSLGWLAQHFGLQAAMLVPLVICGLLVVGSIRFYAAKKI